jgi:predicted hotdog family 3-hydroxylacyl-ACP dehydratase
VLTPPLEREAIARLVPHQERMCLLDRALAWSAERILCETNRHRMLDNPLRRDGMLPAVCGLEFALQAMALHGALMAGAGRAQAAGFVSSLREVTIGTDRLDTISGSLCITAEVLAAETHGFIYQFEIRSAGELLLSGRAAVILPKDAS